MKVSKICVFILMFLFLSSDISYAQRTREYINKIAKYGSRGKLEKANQELNKIKQSYYAYKRMSGWSEIIEDALEEKVDDEFVMHFFKGAAYENKLLHDEAINEYKKAIAINSNYYIVHYNLGVCYNRKELFNEAIAAYKQAIAINSDDERVHFKLALIYKQKALGDEAIAEYKKAIAINPKHIAAHNNLGVCYYQRGLFDEAIAEYKKAIAIDPDHSGQSNLEAAYREKEEIERRKCGMTRKYPPTKILIIFRKEPER